MPEELGRPPRIGQTSSVVDRRGALADDLHCGEGRALTSRRRLDVMASPLVQPVKQSWKSDAFSAAKVRSRSLMVSESFKSLHPGFFCFRTPRSLGHHLCVSYGLETRRRQSESERWVHEALTDIGSGHRPGSQPLGLQELLIDD
jgi:hypothetical protein